MILLIWSNTGCKVFKSVVVPFANMLVSILLPILRFFRMSKGIIQLLYTIMYWLNTMTCDYKPLSCGMEFKQEQNVELGALPVASRCWADFLPTVDESDAFSCTRSDTCRVAGFSSGTGSLDKYGFLKEDGNQIVCDACPLQPGQ